MNRHGQRFVNLREFKSHANSLNVGLLDDRELEFYEKHCLLLPAVRFHHPPAYRVAVTQRRQLWPVASPEDLTPPDALRQLQPRHVDGLHPFDAELGNNPLLATPDCAKFEPWDTDETVIVTAPDGHPRPLPLVERYYAPWQLHVVARLREQKHYYVHSRFLTHIDRDHDLWKRYSIPEDTEQIRSLQGMATGFDALERYRYADQVALNETFDGVPSGEPLPKPAYDQFRAVVSTWARQSLEVSGVDEPTFFRFLSKLARLVEDYRRGERTALAEDAEEYLLDAQRLARDAFGYDWYGFLAAAEEHVEPGLAAELRRLDPVEAAAHNARENLKAILSQDPVAAIAADYEDVDAVPDAIVEFCMNHDLWEVLDGLQRYSYTDADLRRDRFPGYFHRGLRSLALAGEQLARGILDVQAELGHDAAVSHHGRPYSDLIRIVGAESSWLPSFTRLRDSGATSDKEGNLDQRAVSLTKAALAAGADRDEVIANTLAAAVATRNLVSHRHQFLPLRVARTLGGPCADAVVLIWLIARDAGRV